MRDKWRVDDEQRESARRRERRTHGHREISPAAPRREKEAEVGLKIKGRANVDSAPASPSRTKRAHKGEEVSRSIKRGLSPSPQRRRPRDELQSRRSWELSRDRKSERSHREFDLEPRSKRRRTRSRSVKPEISDYRDERRRHPSPVYPSRSDRHRRRSRSRSRHRETGESSAERLSRGDYYSSSYPEPTRFGDSYIPGTHRRSSPPVRERAPPRRHSPPSDKYQRTRNASPPPRRPRSPENFSREDRDPRGPIHPPAHRLRETLRTRRAPKASHKSSHPSSRRVSRSPSRRHRRSRSPFDRRESRRSRTKMQQSPTRPIQSILDDGSHHPPHYQRATSFDTSQGQSIYAMPGTTTGNGRGAHRTTRPPHLNTQHSYSTSPQWTPASSHHGSPHSGSPFSQGRGGWNGQQQHYQAQARYVLLFGLSSLN